MSFNKLSNEDINNILNKIIFYHEKYLKNCGVLLPKFKEGNLYTKNALVLAYLSQDYPNTKICSKEEITEFMRQYFPQLNDVQQPRHLGAQSGFYILSGQRGDFSDEKIPSGSYKLKTLETPYPGFKNNHRKNELLSGDWDEIKKIYKYRCATCGSKEGENSIHWDNVITELQKGHMDPNKPLSLGNIIPQCKQCNQADRNRWVYDEKGRVIKLADPKFVKNFDKEVKLEIYKILKKEFDNK